MPDHGHRAAGLPVLLLDFDGTVCVGDGPVWAYAEAVINRIVGAQALEAASAIRAELRAFLSGDDAPRYIDGYDAVARLATQYASRADLTSAYLSSRRSLANGTVDVAAPQGLGQLLDDLAGSVCRVLVTNAPDDDLSAVLTGIGLRDSFDVIITNAAKPEGWRSLLPTFTGSRPPAFVMAVGDIWANDIAPLLDAGCVTALIDRFRRRDGPSHVTASRLEDLYDAIRAWAMDPITFARRHPVATSPESRRRSSDRALVHPAAHQHESSSHQGAES